MIPILSICDKSYLVQILLICKIIFKLVCYIVPSIIIITSIIGFTKSITGGKEEDLKDNLKVLVRKIIAGLVIIFIPTLVSFAINHLADESMDLLTCFESASKEKYEQLKAKEKAEEEAEQKQKEKEDEKALREAYEKDQKDRTKQKQTFEEWKKEREKQQEQSGGGVGTGDVEITTGGVDAQAFKNKLASMSTPTLEQITSAAAQSGISAEYVKIVLGTTYNEGYFNDPYLYYGWASAMINVQVTIEQMQGWDPGHYGEANFYSWTNINKGVNNATPDVLKAVYLAFTERNTKIVECNGMYNQTPSSYNLLYKSSVYNCSIYEKK